MKIRTLFIILLLILLNSFSHAIAGKDIYKYVDKDGNITFTNRPISNAQKISIASFSRNSEPAGLQTKSPRVKDPTRQERDAKRRQILEKELANEEKLFADTQDFLLQTSNDKESGNYQEKAVQLRNKLSLHQRNVAALKKELSKF